MARVVSASEAKNSLGTILSLVRNEGETVIVENRGAPTAAIISIAAYEQLQTFRVKARREAAMAELRAIRTRIDGHLKDLTSEERRVMIEQISSDVMDGVLAKTKLRFEE